MKVLVSILCLFALVTAGLAQSFAGTYTTTFEGATVKMILQQAADGAVTGTLDDGEQKLNLKGKAAGGRVTGTASLPGVEISLGFRIERQDGKVLFTLLMVDEGETEELTTIPFPAPAGSGGSTKTTETKSEATGPAKTLPGGKVTLPWGTSFSYPAGWSHKSANGETILIPKGARASERYITTVVGVPPGIPTEGEGLSRALKEYLAEATQGMQEIADKSVPAGKGTGRLVAYEWQSGEGTMRMNVYITVQSGLGVGLIGVGKKEDVVARSPQLQSVFETFSTGRGVQDANLAGGWRFSRADRNVDNRGRGTAKFTRDVQLSPDGSLVMQTNSRVVLSGDGYFADTGDSVKTIRGRWFAGNGSLVIIPESGGVEFYGYTLSADGVLRLTSEGVTELYVRR